MNVVPDAWIVYIRSGISVTGAMGILGHARQVARGEAARTARWHVELVGEGDKGFLLIIETMAITGYLRGVLHQMEVDHKAISLLRLRTIQSSGNPQLDQAIKNAIIALYG